MSKTHEVRSEPNRVAARWGAAGALLASLAVLAGAFGAHAIRPRIGADLLAVFETAARYQMIHALALLLVAWALDRAPSPAFARAAWLFLIGIVLFSGSLYALALTGVRGLGAVTPLGGLCLITGWLSFAWGLWRWRAT